jgi:small-conductance mechanosensitive channel
MLAGFHSTQNNLTATALDNHMTPIVTAVLSLCIFLFAPVVLSDLLINRQATLLTGLVQLLSGLGLVQSLVRLGFITLRRLQALQIVPVLRLGQFVGYVVVLIVAASAAGYNLTGFLAGGTVLTAVVGLAAQSTLANVFAGLVLSASRAYMLGDVITVRSWAFGGVEYTGTIRDITLIHTIITTTAGDIKIPNARMVDAALTTTTTAPLELVLPVHTNLSELAGLGVSFQVRKLSPDGLEITVYSVDAATISTLQQFIPQKPPESSTSSLA